MKPGEIRIPKSDLQRRLDATVALQRSAAGLLQELEQAYLGRSAGKLGQWRQDPQAWAAKR